jgi:4-amino-4-deoxy-L-arabinose transferase-like glycosyltransferase
MDSARALAGTLLLVGVYFFFWPTPEFNHNVAQMPLWALVMLTLWRATTQGGAGYWLMLGVFAGLSMWAKYSSGVLLVIAAAWMVWDGQARKRILTPGPWLALLAFVLVITPQVAWLVEHDFAPFAYAARRASVAEWYEPLEFLLTLAVDHLPMFILLAAAGFFARPTTDAPQMPEARAMRYLLSMALGPALLTAAASIASGAGLRASWGAPMVVLSGLLAVALLSARFSTARLRRLTIGAGCFLALTAGLYFAHMAYGLSFTGRPLRGNWPQAAISADLEARWAQETGAPLRIVAGEIWNAGLVGLRSRTPPSILIGGDYSQSPWVTPEEVARDGALIVWRADQQPPPALAEFAAGLETHEAVFIFSRFPNVAPITLIYAIRKPAP